MALESFALGNMGMSVEAFANITLVELNLKIKGFRNQQQILVDQQLFVTRWQTTHLINIQLKKEDKIKPTDLYVFDWEEVKPRVPSKERRKQLKAITDKWNKPDNKKVTFDNPDDAMAYIAGLKK